MNDIWPKCVEKIGEPTTFMKIATPLRGRRLSCGWAY